MKTCKDLNITPCGYCVEYNSTNKYCLVDDARHWIIADKESMSICEIVNNFGDNIYYLKALELYYPNLWDQISALLILL
jgi:hypothetical protein